MKVPFEYQKEEYHCGPASLRMMLKAYGVNLDLTEAELGYFCNTNVKGKGTWVRDMNKFLKLLGLKYNIIGVKEIKKELKKGNPLLVSYSISGVCRHLAVVTKLKDYRKSPILYLNDPYYGKDWKYPLETFQMLDTYYWRLDAR